MQCKIDDLPDELLEYILSLVPPYKALEVCKFVCKRWQRTTEGMHIFPFFILYVYIYVYVCFIICIYIFSKK